MAEFDRAIFLLRIRRFRNDTRQFDGTRAKREGTRRRDRNRFGGQRKHAGKVICWILPSTELPSLCAQEEKEATLPQNRSAASGPGLLETADGEDLRCLGDLAMISLLLGCGLRR